MLKTETPRKPKVIQKEKNKLSERKMSEESEYGQSEMVKSRVVVTRKTPKKELNEPPWRKLHLSFRKLKLKPSQIKFTKREVSKREGLKKEDSTQVKAGREDAEKGDA